MGLPRDSIRPREADQQAIALRLEADLARCDCVRHGNRLAEHQPDTSCGTHPKPLN